MVAVLAMTAFLLLHSSAHAAPDLGFASQDGGKAGAFLDFAASARSMGMGRAHVGVADDADAIYWNPSGLAQIQRKDIVASYSSLYEQTSYGVFNYAQPTVDLGTFGFGLVNLRSTNFEKRDAGGLQGGSFNTAEMAFLLSHGMELNSRWSVGSTLKVIREEVDAFSGTGIGLDGGMMLRLSPSFQMGLTFRNVLAPKITLRHEADRYPFDARLGLKWQALKKLMVAVDLDKTTGRSIKPYVGGEWSLSNLIAVRAGLSETELTTGLGFKFKDWGLDYAFGFQDAASGLKDLGSSHRFGFHVNFGKKVFEQEASLRWRKKGQVYLASLGEKMDHPDQPNEQEISRLIADTRRVIHLQGYLKAADLYAAQGYVSYFDGEFERSVQSLGESLALDPQNTSLAAHLEKARAQLTEERTREIVVLELKRVKELYTKADWRGTAKSCEKILSFQPDNIEANTYLEDAKNRINEPIQREMKIAKLKFDRGEYLDAIKSFQKVKEMEPENKEAGEYIARSIAALEKQASLQEEAGTNQVRPVYEMERNSAQSRAFYSKGLSLYSQGKLREAAAVWEQAIRNDSSNTLARNAYNRAQIELKENP